MDLSVAIIFKNEIRCIERCLKSLQPLKECVSCEIVMADTGSTDGSREIAARYADVLFDFPWVNDFSAARNAVLERCCGTWTLMFDCDEWLSGVPEELISFLKSTAAEQADFASVISRNYYSQNMETYGDFPITRMMRMAAHPRYEGAIHESPHSNTGSGRSVNLHGIILHHDGYVMLNDGSDAGKEKAKRNQTLLKAELEKEPNDLRRLLQLLECTAEEEEYLSVIRHAAALVIKRSGEWKRYGAAILRYAIGFANYYKLPELGDWTRHAYEMFPGSYYTRIDTAFILAAEAYDQADYDDCISYGEAYLEACGDFDKDPEAFEKVRMSTLQKQTAYWREYVRLRLADAYCEKGGYESALRLLERTDWGALDAGHTTRFVKTLGKMPARVSVNSLIQACWDGICAPIPSAELANERMEAFRKLITVEYAQPEAGPEQVPPELLAAAARVKAILEKLPPDDPMAKELKNSEAYQKIAWLIERGLV